MIRCSIKRFLQGAYHNPKLDFLSRNESILNCAFALAYKIAFLSYVDLLNATPQSTEVQDSRGVKAPLHVQEGNLNFCRKRG